MPEILIRTIDAETTGKMEEPGAEVIEIGYTDLVVDSESRAFHVGETITKRFGCSKPMSPEVIAVHHIRNEDIAGMPVCTRDDLRWAVCLGDPLFLAAHNAAFERHWITDDISAPAKWLCTLKAAKHLYPDAPSFSNQCLKYLLGFGDLPHERCMPPHAAGPDSYVTAYILGHMLQSTTGQQIEAWTREPEWHPRCPIGKHRNQPWPDIPHDFLGWMLRAPDMAEDLKHCARVEIARRRDALIATQKEAPQ